MEDYLVKERMWKENKKLVTYVIHKQFSSYSHIKDELVAEGQWGLWKAVDTYDFTRTFSTYACIIIRRQILQYLRKPSRFQTFESLNKIVCEDKTDDEENPTREYCALYEKIVDNDTTLEDEENLSILRDLNINKYFYKSENYNELLELLYKGYSNKEISQHYNCSRQTACNKVRILRKVIEQHREEIIKQVF